MKIVIPLALVTLFASSAFAQKPVKGPVVYEPPLEFAAGEVCSFPVHLQGDGKQNQIQFPSGREMIVGQGSTTVTNVVTGRPSSWHSLGGSRRSCLRMGLSSSKPMGRSVLLTAPGRGRSSPYIGDGSFSFDS